MVKIATIHETVKFFTRKRERTAGPPSAALAAAPSSAAHHAAVTASSTAHTTHQPAHAAAAPQAATPHPHRRTEQGRIERRAAAVRHVTPGLAGEAARHDHRIAAQQHGRHARHRADQHRMAVGTQAQLGDQPLHGARHEAAGGRHRQQVFVGGDGRRGIQVGRGGVARTIDDDQPAEAALARAVEPAQRPHGQVARRGHRRTEQPVVAFERREHLGASGRIEHRDHLVAGIAHVEQRG